jgi:crotonobetainyl-CoA:carnitine CoA-transferase CaiB-like acyl-CoA transferase
VPDREIGARAGPLAGLKVLELSSFISASFAGTLLGDFGADVVKVELPGKGDLQRGLGTFTPGDDERNLWWMALSRNKRSIAMDLRQEASRPVVEKLYRWADVVTENFRPGTLERWEIGWDLLHRVNPAAIMLRVTGFGQTGPYRERASFERVGQAFSGFMYVTGDPDRPPQKAGLPICDYTSGVWGALGVVLALVDRLRSGADGQVIDNALYEAILPAMKDDPAVFALTGKVAERVGNRSDNVAPGEAYRTRDGHWLFIAPTGDSTFQRAMRAIGRPEWAEDPRFATTNDRLANRQPLDSAMESWVSDHDRDEVMSVMEKATVPCSRVQSIADLLNDPHVRSREDFVTIQDATIGDVTVPNVFPRLSASPGTIRRNAPRIGEHTTEFLAGEIGIEAGELEDLRRAGAIQ